MKSSSRFGPPFILSVLLHLGVALLLFYAARQTVTSKLAPVAVELWTSAPLAPAAPAVVVQKTVKTAPAPVETAKPEPVVEPPKADIQLAKKPKLQKHEASAAKKAETKPIERKPIERKPVEHKPIEHPPLPSTAKSVTDKKPLATAKTPMVDKPGKGKKAARHYSDDTNDLLADLNSSNTTRPANARADRAGAATGAIGGVSNGSAKARDNYATKVQSRVRPLVQLPPDLSGNPKAIVLVQLLPTLEVRTVKLLQSSGNAAYDEAVQRAIWEAKTFPPLPQGVAFSDVRQIKLEFRPK